MVVMGTFKLKSISMGGRIYLDQETLLDFLSNRDTLVTDKLKVHGTSQTDTEYLRGQLFEQEIIKNAIQSST
jgi:hypothetical protein